MFEKVLVKYDGSLNEFQLADLDLEHPEDPSDVDLKSALCVALAIPDLDGYMVRRATSVINVCPNPTFA